MLRSRGLIWMLALALSTAWVAAAAELRTWKMADGATSLDAEYVDVKAGSVVLKKRDGWLTVVPVSRLSPDDQQYVLDQSGGKATIPGKTDKPGAKLDPDVPECLATPEQDAMACVTAKQAVQVYKFFLAEPDLIDEQKTAANVRLDHWSKLADEDYEKLGDRWLPGSEADSIRKETDEIVVHALELLRLRNHELAHSELVRASRLNPTSEKADFLMGWVYALVANNDQKAVQHFREAVRRNPKSSTALNNLAVCEVQVGLFLPALDHWKQAIAIDPECQTVADNLGSTIEAAAHGVFKIPTKPLSMIDEFYRDLLAHSSLQPAAKSMTLTYLTPYGRQWKGGGDSLDSLVAAPPEDAISICSGTGFVIAPGYILTNFHVVEDAETVMIFPLNWKRPVDPDAKTDGTETKPDETKYEFIATVVATSKDPDLALLKCDKINAPPIALADAMARRGSDIMALGYPGGLAMGSALKSSRGAIISLADPTMENMCIHNAPTNPGNSGGPIVDDHGRLVAVVVAITTQLANNYGLAIPLEQVAPFIKTNLLEFKSVEAAETALDWPSVDERVSPGVVLIMCKCRRHKND